MGGAGISGVGGVGGCGEGFSPLPREARQLKLTVAEDQLGTEGTIDQ